MKIKAFILLSIIITVHCYGQTKTLTSEKKELKLSGGGYAIFNVLMEDNGVVYISDKDYYWYNQYSGLKSTKGSSGGSLLHGKYLEYFASGDLALEMDYKLGLIDGVCKEWDESGILVSNSKYSKGEITYTKFKDKNGYYIEWIGELFRKGSIKNVYNETGNELIQKNQFIDDFIAIITDYYPYTKGKVETTFIGMLGGDLKYGFFKAYYKNGQLKVDGNYENTNRTGIWKYYNEFGQLIGTESYRIHKEYFPNGEMKIEGGESLDPVNKTWIKHGYWKYYKPDGEYDLKIYSKGEETIKLENY